MPEPQQQHEQTVVRSGVDELLEEVQDKVGCLSFSPPPMKHSETRDSISSIDSDVSLSFDTEKLSTEAAVPEDEGAHMADMSDSASDAGSAGGKDSGCEVTPEVKDEPPFTPPSDELADKIVAQVEFYFSDVNITKDAFLLKHVKRNKEGYVSLKLISSFKRVKHLTKDWRVVAHALTRSTKLEINEAGTKLRRVDPLPQYDQTAPSRTVVAVHMPIDKPTIENVAELFSCCGEIALIRVLRPGNPVPADVRHFINKNPTLSGMVCALVEFVDSESARNALQMQNEPLKVYELNGVPNPERKKKPQMKKAPQQVHQVHLQHHLQQQQHAALLHNSLLSRILSETEQAEDGDCRLRLDAKGRVRRGSAALPPRPIEPIAWLQRRLSATSTEAGFMLMPRRSSRGDASDLLRRVSHGSLSGSEGGYCSRRASSSSYTSDSSGPRSRSNSSACHLPENVLRMPQGPDGSRGFRPRCVQPSH